MADVTTNCDTLLHVYQESEELSVGINSKYSSTAHPGTENLIKGWEWDRRPWPSVNEFKATEVVPSIWDPEISGIDRTYFQSGYGDNKDLLLLGLEEVYQVSGINPWAPKVNHGYYYIYNDEWYLHSDSYQTQYFTKDNTVSGLMYLSLDYNYKPTIPIRVHGYNYNRIDGEYTLNNLVEHRVTWSSSSPEPEFIIDTDHPLPMLWVSGVNNLAKGRSVTSVSGVPLLADLDALEQLGVSDGTADQRFYFSSLPVDSSQPIEVWSYRSDTDARQWNVISGLDEFTPSGGVYEARVDLDMGWVEFGDYDFESGTGSSDIPLNSHKIGVYYTPTIAAMYEPENTYNYLIGLDADVNPIRASKNSGFIQTTTSLSEPASIVLVSDLPTNSPTYSIDLGNNVGKLTATVKDKAGVTLEGINVTFEILDPQVGTFGTSSLTTISSTNAVGQAVTRYNSPNTILDIGSASNIITGGTVLTVDDVPEPSSVSGIYLYKIWDDDPVLGINASGIDTYYDNYLEEHDLVSGVTASGSWEADWRTTYDLPRPVTYTDEAEDLYIGRKTIVLTANNSQVIDPQTGQFTTSGLSPIFPTDITNIGTEANPQLELTYPSTLDAIGDYNTKGYYVIGEGRTNIRAYCVSPRTGRRIYSNTIGVVINIPDTHNGTYQADAITTALTRPRNIVTEGDQSYVEDSVVNETSGIEDFWRAYLDERLWTAGTSEDYVDWFRRTRFADTTAFETAALTVTGFDPGLLSVTHLSYPGIIPLGFRLKSTNNTMASVLDSVCFLNSSYDYLPSGIFS